MSEQSDAANRFARGLGGGGVEPPGGRFRVLPSPDGDGGDGEQVPPEWVKLPGEGRPVSAFAREMGAALKDCGLFRRELVPVTIHPETGDFAEVTSERFITLAEEFLVTHVTHYSQKEGARDVPKSMPVAAARAVLNSDQFLWQLPAIDRVNHVRLPVMRADGRIELLPEGYDAKSKTYTMKSGVEIDESLTPGAGVKVIENYLREFPFGDWKADTEENREARVVGQSRSQSVAVSGMLSLFGASLQGLTAQRLNFAFTSNAQGSGKTLLGQLCVTPVMGRCYVQALPTERAELKKILDSEALAASPYIFLDNIKGNLSDSTLEAFTTATWFTGRMMGGQKKFNAPKLSTLFLTGNNMTLSTDLARRVLICELYVEEADIRDRQVQRLMTSAYFERPQVRGDILSALWAMVRGWDEAGRPDCSRRIPGYEEWSRIFGGIVEHAGFGCPLEPIESEHIGDTEMSDMLVMLEALVKDLDGAGEARGEYEFQDLVDVCQAESCFEWIINGGKVKKSSDGDESFELPAKEKSMLGKLFAGKYGGRRFRLKDGRQVVFGKKGKNRHRRYLVEIS